MNDKNLTVALLPNSSAMMHLLAAQRGFLAIANNDDILECVALFPPANDKQEYDNNLHTARLMAAAPQLFRALEAALLVIETAVVLDDAPSDDLKTKAAYLFEFIAGKMGNQTDGGIVDLPKFF